MIITLILLPFYAYFGAMWTAVIAVLLLGCFIYMRKKNNYFPNNGIKCLPTYLPFVGNALNLVLQRQHMLDFLQNIYTKFPDEKYIGLKNLSQNVILLRDLNVIKQIAIKDFDYFVNHLRKIEPSIDPLLGNSIAALSGQKWRDMRATLSPAFTSSKMKGMFDFVNECGDQMVKYFLKELAEQKKDKKYLDIELKDVFSRYTNDVIATSAFGINVDSLKNPENEFYSMGKKATSLSGLRLFKFLAMVAFPRLMKLAGFNGLMPDVSNFFRNIVNSSMKMREEQKIIRHDMIHLLMEAKKGSLKHEAIKTDGKDAGFATVEESDIGKQTHQREWSDDEIVAQAVIFFLAGYEASSILLSFMGYELGRNPDIQKRLQEEIDDIAERNNGKVNYEDLQHMKYMDMVVSETLRHWPPAIMTDRKCVKSYTLPPSRDENEKGGHVNVGDGLWIPIYAIHHDPQYYKDPEKFDPERFSDENKHEINPLAYMPFGVGPRNCIGSRFALMEVKSVMFYLLHTFEFIITDKTSMSLKLNKKALNLLPKEGLWLGLQKREKR